MVRKPNLKKARKNLTMTLSTLKVYKMMEKSLLEFIDDKGIK